MSLLPWQYSYNGLTLGAGTVYGVTNVTGLRELPPIRKADTPKARADGSYAGQQYADERVIQFTVTVGSPTGLASYEQALEAAGTAFAPITDPTQLLPLLFWPGGNFTLGRPVQVNGRPTKGGYPTDKNQTLGFVQALAVELTCPDPLIYDSQVTEVTAGLPSPTSGASFPMSFPVSFGASTGGSMTVVNAGNYPTAPVFTITGPCTNPSVSLQSTGQTLKFGITLGSSDSLVVDCGAHTVTLNGTASRYNTIQGGSQWFTCPPGTQTFGFASTDATQVAAECTAAIRSAWAWL